MKLTTVTYGLTAVVPHPTNNYVNMKPYVEMAAELEPGDDLEAIKTLIRTEVKKALAQFAAECEERLGLLASRK